MPDSILDRIRQGPPVLFDGALGARLIQMGLPAGSPPEARVLEFPDRIARLHADYAAAGADVMTTCTFGGNRLRLKKASLQDRLAEINRRAVELAREAAGEGLWVAGNMGPTGEFFQPHGSLTEQIASDVFQEQAYLLSEAGVDFFLLETFYDLKETLICLTACRQTASDIPAAVSMTFNHTPRGFFTVMGDSAAEALRNLADEGAFLVGANCTLEAEGMLELAREISSKLNLPLLFQPNAGSPQITPDGIVYPQGPQEFAGYVAEMLSLKVRAVGGCCGTTADHIAALRAAIDESYKLSDNL